MVPEVLLLLLTFALPFVNAWVQKVTWTPVQKNLVALATSAIFAILYLFLTGGLDLSNVPVAIAAVYGLQQAIYQFMVKNIATKFEAITTKGAIVVSPSDEAGKVEITTDATISNSDNNSSSMQADPPIEITPDPTPASTEDTRSVEIVKDNVVG
jgi:hypothetical protein